MKGLIKSFTTEAGFGTLQLEDGTEVPFDFSSCENPPLDNQLAGKTADEVVTAVGRTGRLRAVRVVFTAPKEWGFTAAVRLLKLAGFLTQWTSAAAIRETYKDGAPPKTVQQHALGILAPYYAEAGLTARAREDRVLRLDARGAELAAELASLLNLEAKPRATSDIASTLTALESELRALGRSERLVLLQGEVSFVVVADEARLPSLDALKADGILAY